MAANKSGIDEFTDSFTQDEICQEYKKLLSKYKQLKSIHDTDQQRIYELKRNWETASAAESYLSQELENLTATQNSEIEKVQEKYSNEIETLKKKQAVMVVENGSLEQKLEEFREENEELRRKIDDLMENTTGKDTPNSSNGSMERELQLAKENLELLAKVDECRDQMTTSMMSLAERERQIDILKEQVECLEENLQAKRDEVEEKGQLLESSQERVMELSSELALLKSAPEDNNRKGNSLFAEVDDQRQQMKKILAAQRKHYLQMRKCYNDSEQEIRRLKRENAAIAKEIQACAAIFLSSNKRYKEKLNERIVQLTKQNEALEKKLFWTQEKMIALSLDKGINWLDSMLTFCRNETENLKEQLRSCRMQKGILEEQLLKSQQELARWRFEALKSRCIIIDRESRLEENKINFKPVFFNITEKELELAQPQIFTENHRNIENVEQMENVLDVQNKNLSTSMKSFTHMNVKIESPTNITEHAKDVKTVNIDTTPTSSRKQTPTEYKASNNSMLSTTTRSELASSEKSNNSPEINSNVSNVRIKEELKSFGKMSSYSKTPFKCKLALANHDEGSEACKNGGIFEIYEDTACKIPSIKLEDVNKTSENPSPPKDEPVCFQVLEDTIGEIPMANEVSKNVPSAGNNAFTFDIYEDTICRLPTMKINSTDDQSKENIPITINHSIPKQYLNTSADNLEQKVPTSHMSPVLDDEHNSKFPSLPQSILVKNRNVFDDPTNDNKTVTFSPELTTEIKDERGYNFEDKSMRSKSHVTVKRIVVKSNFNKKP